MFASRSKQQHQNGADASPPPTPPVTLAPTAGMADAMLRKMLGVGLSDLQGIADQAGQMLAKFDARLEAIERQNTEILARLEYLAIRHRK